MPCFLISGSSKNMEHEQKAETSSGVYTYKHHCERGLHIHEIFVRKSRSRVVLSYIGIVFLLTNVCQSLLAQDLSLGSVWNLAFAVLVAKCLQYKPVKKESVVIMPSFGIQLEVHCWSFPKSWTACSMIFIYGATSYAASLTCLENIGRVDRQFVPIGKILKPLLNECVTPVTCYWSLALLLRDEEELLLVFQKIHPPVKMLVPVWKALCTLINVECPSLSGVHEPNSSET